MPSIARLLGCVWILLSGLLLGCGREPVKKGPGPEAKARGTIGISLLTLANPFFKVIGDTITAEGAKHGYDTIVLSADMDVAKQANQVKDFIVRKVSAIVLSPCESRAVVPILQEANKAGIPVFTVDIPCLEKGVNIVCQVATDNYQGGKEAAKAMIEALGGEGGKVAVVHFPQAESCRLRVKGFEEVVAEHNAKAAAPIKIVTRVDGGGAKDVAFKIMEDVLQAHDDLRGIFAINDPSALGSWSAVDKAKRTKQITIIGFDGQPEGKQAIKDGKIFADPIQYPDKMGVEVVKAIVSHSRGDEVPATIFIPTTLYTKAEAAKDTDLK